MLLWVFFLVTLTLSSGSNGSLPSQPLRIPRYADAIFTNSYRKVLGQLSARKLLQDIMNRQQGERNQEQGAKVRPGRQVDGLWTDQQQMALESILVSLLQERRALHTNSISSKRHDCLQKLCCILEPNFGTVSTNVPQRDSARHLQPKLLSKSSSQKSSPCAPSPSSQPNYTTESSEIWPSIVLGRCKRQQADRQNAAEEFPRMKIMPLFSAPCS